MSYFESCSQYCRVIIPSRSGGYYAQMLELRGCYAQGETVEEAYSNLDEMAEIWFEDAVENNMLIPPPWVDALINNQVRLSGAKVDS